ncbi:MAG: hypothetical protein LBE09_04140 [Christensenellaceae bacterium]|jgi:hypothetical protein|nr:hypothetical protein [Christensenellaceae bacterium]
MDRKAECDATITEYRALTFGKFITIKREPRADTMRCGEDNPVRCFVLVAIEKGETETAIEEAVRGHRKGIFVKSGLF